MKHDDEDGERIAEELRQMLRERGFVIREPEPFTEGDRIRGEEVLREILALPRNPAPTSIDDLMKEYDVSARPMRRSVVRGLLLAAVAAAVALVFVIAQPPRTLPPTHAVTPPLLAFDGARPGTVPAQGRPAAGVLDGLAERVAHQPAPADLPVQHVTLSAWFSSTGDDATGALKSVLEPVERESWFQPDATMRVREQRGRPLDADGRLDRIAGLVGTSVADESFASPDPGPGYAAALPTDPTRLAKRFARIYNPADCPARGECLIREVTDLYGNYVVSPELASALWRVLAMEPSITYLGETRDRIDRRAAAFTTPTADGTAQKLLLISPATGTYLGEEEILVKPNEGYAFKPPAVVTFSALVSSARVPLSDVPPGGTKY